VQTFGEKSRLKIQSRIRSVLKEPSEEIEDVLSSLGAAELAPIASTTHEARPKFKVRRGLPDS
jgi:hypothetical protein